MSALPEISTAVVIGASVGAIEALSAILPTLRADFPHPVLVVVHLPPARKSGLVALFAERCRLEVKEAEDKEPLAAGKIYFAPPDYHLMVEPDGSISLSNEEPVLYSRPAIDVLFESAADAFGDGLTGVVLTGASRDGAHGLQAVHAAGGEVFVQDPETAEGAVMPLAALASCPSAKRLSLAQIAAELNRKILPSHP